MRKVAELEGAELDYWVAKAAGYLLDEDGDRVDHEGRDSGGAPGRWRPSIDWSDGGPIIERERIDLEHACNRGEEGFDERGDWRAFAPTLDGVNLLAGPTPLIAAMRAYVAAKYGAEVPPIASQPE